jgi:hypothetical protein
MNELRALVQLIRIQLTLYLLVIRIDAMFLCVKMQNILHMEFVDMFMVYTYLLTELSPS